MYCIKSMKLKGGCLVMYFEMVILILNNQNIILLTTISVIPISLPGHIVISNAPSGMEAKCLKEWWQQ
ncbi:hypothetical protein L6452_20644 [Arctium lappa]|uniref:Uncharacterized protein n=1 Tax=Arctium lappa TaxID=4217 RepID=A0ACB9BGC1_ARCLA|nr:hypothetical protein L6452_20644 [Arctium lappa]